MSNSINYPSFEARLTLGSLTELNTRNMQGETEPDENKHHYFMGFAVRKGPDFDALKACMTQALQEDTLGKKYIGSADFNYKIEDCDVPKKSENLGSDSYPAGHMIIKFKRMKSVGMCKVFKNSKEQGGKYVEYNPMEFKDFKKGDYFFVAGACSFNGRTDSPALYQNVNGVMFSRAGDEIVSASVFDPAMAFGGSTPAPAPTVAPAPAPTIPPPPPATAILDAKYSITELGRTNNITEAVIDQWLTAKQTTLEALKAAKWIL